jgi:GH15 family glucan-1,4-alpha-glucosidase
MPIEDYALVGDTRTAALVGKDGSIDWLCLPRFDSGACFAKLLGEREHGHWSLRPRDAKVRTTRRYRGDTLVLETQFTVASGTVRVVDCMPPDEETPNLVRVVEGVDGEVAMQMELVIRFDYGRVVPWVRRIDGALLAIGGPDALTLHTPVEHHGENLTTVADFTVRAGQRLPFVLSWHPSHLPAPTPIDPITAVANAEAWWQSWAAQGVYDGGPWRDAVMRSMITLKAMTYTPTGGIVAAATTSLPEHLGGVRNWDYRYTWLRDATFTLYALTLGGFAGEACAWRDWLLRAVAGSPDQLQIMYGVAGERRLPELELPWLPGYAGSTPVRVGNGAVDQFQLDVYGEVMDALHQAHRFGTPPEAEAWHVQRKMLDFLESKWRLPDDGLWETRGGQQHFTHSKMMSWVAFDRAVKAVERHGCGGPTDKWRALRDEIHREVCERGFDRTRGTFTQAYDSSNVDAALLMMPLVGFLPATDPRVLGTIAAIERELVREGFVMRYRTTEMEDGLPPGEGVFLLCSFWLADTYALTGRHAEAQALFERLLAIRNDVGLLAEEYDPAARHMLGNFPQAFSHVGLVNTAFNLSPRYRTPAKERKES